jgi:hypothetical protein
VAVEATILFESGRRRFLSGSHIFCDLYMRSLRSGLAGENDLDRVCKRVIVTSASCRRRSRPGSAVRFSELLVTVVVGGMLVGPIMLLVVVSAPRMMFLEHEREPEAPRRCGPAGFRLNKVMIHPRSAEVRGELTC